MSDQPVRLDSPLGEDLLFHSLEADDEMGRPFHFEVGLLSPLEDLAFDDLLGTDVTIELDLPRGGTRYFHGFITEFAQTGRNGDYVTYAMSLRPWIWFLSRTADCRIFQGMTVPDIVKSVFREHGFSDFEDKLTGSYRTWEYLVQYRETDFNFVSRLLEQEGIYYYFLHEQGKHTLVLADSYGSHNPLPDYETILYFPPSENVVREEHLFSWAMRRTVQSGTFVQTAFDFRKPRANLTTDASISRRHAEASYEVFDYPGEYFTVGEGDNYARARIEEIHANFERVSGVGNPRGVFAGGLFTLSEHPRADSNREHLVVSCHHSIGMIEYESGSSSDLEVECRLEAIDSREAFRALRSTPKPVVQGPQTAIVVGPSGEEIWTDEYGRVKVQFHWDRYGKRDENSSCWVRVAQVWAGTNWGGMFIPRIGQEVIVDFIEGDPDRPIITGRVYNADNMPPYDLPADKTKSTMKSRSSKQGTPDNFNEIRFEDKKGEEEMYLHAEKDQNIVVEHDKTESVGHDNIESVGNNEKIQVGNNRNKKVGVDQSETIGSNKTIQVGSNHTENIGANMVQTVGANKAETITTNKALTIGAAYQVSVGGSKGQTIGASKTDRIGTTWSVDVGRDSSESVNMNKSVTAGQKISLTSGDDFSVQGGKNGIIEIADELVIKVGKATIVLKKSGDIIVNGKKISVKASGDVVMKAKKILEN